VDDGSTDGTVDLDQQAAMGRPQIRLLRHQSNCGYSSALRTGLEAAGCELVAFTDAVCQFHLIALSALIDLAEDHAVAVGFRMRGVSEVSLHDIPRTLATLLPFWWTRVMFPTPQVSGEWYLVSGKKSRFTTHHSPDRRSWILDFGFWTVLLAAVLLFFARIRS